MLLQPKNIAPEVVPKKHAPSCRGRPRCLPAHMFMALCMGLCMDSGRPLCYPPFGGAGGGSLPLHVGVIMEFGPLGPLGHGCSRHGPYLKKKI